MKQIRHIRTSKKGKRFVAGSKDEFGKFGSVKWQNTMDKTIMHKIQNNEPLSVQEKAFIDIQLSKYPKVLHWKRVKSLLENYKATGKYGVACQLATTFFKDKKYPLVKIPVISVIGQRDIWVAPESLRIAMEVVSPNLDSKETMEIDSNVFEYVPDNLIKKMDIQGILKNLHDDVEWRLR